MNFSKFEPRTSYPAILNHCLAGSQLCGGFSGTEPREILEFQLPRSRSWIQNCQLKSGITRTRLSTVKTTNCNELVFGDD